MPTPAKSVLMGRTVHTVCAVLCVMALIASISLLASGRGTSVDAGYVFHDYYTLHDTNGTLVAEESSLSFIGRSTSVAEAMVPVTLVLLAVYHFLLGVDDVRKDTKQVAVDQEVNPLRLAVETLVFPLIVGQAALLARIADGEKVGALMFLAFAIGLLDLASEALHPRNLKQAYEKVPDSSGFIEGVYDWTGATYTAVVGAISTLFVFLWVVLITNMAWQYDHGNATNVARNTFVVGALLAMLHRLCFFLVLARKLPYFLEYVSNALLLALVALFSVVSMSYKE